MISIRALTNNMTVIVRSLEASQSVIVVSWLPQYHDMGLIGSVLSMLYCGGGGVYLSPLHFISNPLLWLQLVTKYKATHLQGPNFAYALIVRRFASYSSKAHLNLQLQSIQHIFNAAEPIVVDTVKQFLTTFTPFGLRRVAMTGGYGLAESCVYVSDGGHRALEVQREPLASEDRVDVVREWNVVEDGKLVINDDDDGQL